MRVHLSIWLAGLTGAFLVLLLVVLLQRSPLPGEDSIIRGVKGAIGVIPDPGASVALLALLFAPPIAVLGFLLYKRMWMVAVWFAVAVVSSILVSGILQLVVGRPGPPPLAVIQSQGTPSFPSVSLVEVMVQVVLACYLAWRLSWAWRRIILALAIANVVLISVLLIDESQHWPIDVLGGLLLGAAWAVIAVIAAKRWRRLPRSLESAS